MPIGERKEAYFQRLYQYLDEFEKIIVVHADNVGSLQFQKIRIALRGQAEILMGKNTMVRKALRMKLAENPGYERLIALMRGNVGLIFCNGDLSEVRDIIKANDVGAPARAGAISPCDVTVPAGPTGLEPTMTSFFQALDIPTKINRGSIEIIKDVELLKVGDKVGQSESTLLAKLNIMPFTYGLVLLHIIDGESVYDPSVLDVTQDDLIAKLQQGLSNVTQVSLAIGYPTDLSIPHVLLSAFKNLLAVSVETDYTFEQSEKIKAYLADPSAFAAAAPAAAAAGGGGGDAKKEAAPVEEEEEEDDDMGFGLFD